jgi:hypothetical protein
MKTWRSFKQFAVALVMILSGGVALAADSPDDCFTVTEVLRGTSCGNPGSVQLKCENTCAGPMDVKACVERVNGTWSCGVSFNVKPGEAACKGSWICEGTGKYRVYGRSANSRAPFPEDNVNLRKAGDKVYAVTNGETEASACKRAQQIAGGQDACECEAVNQYFRCRVLAQSVPPEQQAKIKPFATGTFSGTPRADDTIQVTVLYTAKGASQAVACTSVRNAAKSPTAACDCVGKGSTWACVVTVEETEPRGGIVKQWMRNEMEERKRFCLEHPEQCKPRESRSSGVRG